MRTFLNQELNNIVIDESIIKGISWSNDFKDFTIDLDWCGQEDLKNEIDFLNVDTHLFFEFVTEMELSYKFRENTMGGIGITSFLFERNENGWFIQFDFDFYPVGYLKFNCDDFKFMIATR